AGAALVRELVVLITDRRERTIIFLDVVHLRLQQSGDYVGLDEAVARVMQGSELQGARRRKVPLHFILALLLGVGKLRVDDAYSRIAGQLLGLDHGPTVIDLQR